MRRFSGLWSFSKFIWCLSNVKGVYVTQFNTIFRAVSLPFHDLCRPSPSADGAWITTFHGGSDTCFSYITRSGCLVMLNRGELVVLSSNNKHSSSTNNGILCLPARSFADQFADLLWTATIFIATPTRSSFVRWIWRHAQFWINFCNNDVDSSKLKLNYNKEQGFQLPTTTIHGHITWSIE